MKLKKGALCFHGLLFIIRLIHTTDASYKHPVTTIFLRNIDIISDYSHHNSIHTQHALLLAGKKINPHGKLIIFLSVGNYHASNLQ